MNLETIAEWIRLNIPCKCPANGEEGYLCAEARHEEAAELVQLVVRAVYGHSCPTDTAADCPVEHVELSVLGETFVSDSANCVWWCTVYNEVERGRPHPYCRESDDRKHAECPGWQGRWDLLTGKD